MFGKKKKEPAIKTEEKTLYRVYLCHTLPNDNALVKFVTDMNPRPVFLRTDMCECDTYDRCFLDWYETAYYKKSNKITYCTSDIAFFETFEADVEVE